MTRANFKGYLSETALNKNAVYFHCATLFHCNQYQKKSPIDKQTNRKFLKGPTGDT